MSASGGRASVCLAGAWAGLIAAIGFVVAPLLFATLPRELAGRVATQLFSVDASIGLGVGAVLLVLTLQRARRRAEAGTGSRFSAEMVLVLGALACIVAGHYAIEPLLVSARSGAVPRFAVLHGAASAFFVVKFALVAVLAWRLAGADPARAAVSAAAPSS